MEEFSPFWLIIVPSVVIVLVWATQMDLRVQLIVTISCYLPLNTTAMDAGGWVIVWLMFGVPSVTLGLLWASEGDTPFKLFFTAVFLTFPVLGIIALYAYHPWLVP